MPLDRYFASCFETQTLKDYYFTVTEYARFSYGDNNVRAVYSTYVVVAPQIVRAGSTYDVVVTILRATSSVNIDVGLQNSSRISIASSTTTVNAGQQSSSAVAK